MVMVAFTFRKIKEDLMICGNFPGKCSDVVKGYLLQAKTKAKTFFTVRSSISLPLSLQFVSRPIHADRRRINAKAMTQKKTLLATKITHSSVSFKDIIAFEIAIAECEETLTLMKITS